MFDFLNKQYLTSNTVKKIMSVLGKHLLANIVHLSRGIFASGSAAKNYHTPRLLIPPAGQERRRVFTFYFLAQCQRRCAFGLIRSARSLCIFCFPLLKNISTNIHGHFTTLENYADIVFLFLYFCSPFKQRGLKNELPPNPVFLSMVRAFLAYCSIFLTKKTMKQREIFKMRKKQRQK